MIVAGLQVSPAVAAPTVLVPSLLTASKYSVDVNYSLNPGAIAAIQTGLGSPWSLSQVMDIANHDRAALTTCDSGIPRSDGSTDTAKLAGTLGGFCFDSGDTTAHCATSTDTTPDVYPQGITTTRDATGSTYDGIQVVAVSWDRAQSCSNSNFRDMWVTFVDWDSTQPNKYVKVLLVLPTSASEQYDLLSGKSGGLAWYGNYLYVADSHFPASPGGQAVHVFDMRDIFRITSAGSAVGRRSDGSYQAENFGFIMPEVGRLTNHSGSTLATFSTMAVDNSTSAPGLVTGQFNSANSTAAVRFDLSTTTKTLITAGNVAVASQAVSVPYKNVNGVLSHNGDWWFAADVNQPSNDCNLYFWHPGSSSASGHTWLQIVRA
ncbi:MAG: hypothetical protein ACR2N4_08585 [Jatrophihabitans sp.]